MDADKMKQEITYMLRTTTDKALIQRVWKLLLHALMKA